MQNYTDEQLTALKKAEDEAAMKTYKDGLSQRFDNKNLPFIIKNKKKRAISLVLSYVANIGSALGLMYVVVVQLEAMPIYLRWAIAILFLVGFEMLKRYYSDEFWDEYHSTKAINIKNAFINFILLFGLSLAGTAFGLFFVAKDTDPGAAALRMDIDAITTEIKTHTTNKNAAGEIYWPSQMALKGLYKKRDQLNSQLSIASSTLPEQHQTTEYWQQKSDFRAWSLVVLAIILELVFEVCMSFMSRFDFNKFIAIEQLGTPTPLAASHQDNDMIQALSDKLAAATKKMEQMEQKMQQANGMGANIQQIERLPIPNINHSPTVNEYKPMGFNRTNEAVATGGHSVTTEEKEANDAEYQLEIERLVRAYKSAKSDYSKWNAKLKSNKGLASTNQGHMDKLITEMQEIDAEIENLKAA